MPGSFDLTGSTGPLSVVYQAPSVFRFASGTFTWLPNVRVASISEVAGPSPPTARFSYIQDDSLALSLGWPSRAGEIWSMDAVGPYVVQADDRLVVIQPNPDGSYVPLFDGFAQIPQVDLTSNAETATFMAVSVAVREFDSPISGRTQRNGDTTGIQDTSGKSDVGIDLPCWFNPTDDTTGNDGGFRANRTPDNFDTDDGTHPIHPVFTEAGIQGRPSDQSAAYWSISDAIKYILAEYNPQGTWTQYPALSTLDSLLEVIYTADDTSIFNAGDIQTDPLLIRSLDLSNRPWPEAVSELLGLAGFLMRWDLQVGSNGLPTTYLRIYRTDMISDTPLRQAYLDQVGSSLASGSRNNVVRAHLVRDANAIVNAWQVETDQRFVEVGIYLAPLYQIAAADATPVANSTTTGRNAFIKANLVANDADAKTRRKYRWYGADELGEGQWSATQGKWLTGKTFDWSSVFPPDSDGTPSYVARYRPAADTLIATDTLKRPLKARLDVAFAVGSDGAAIQPTGTNFTWYNIPSGWRLLRDRLGIEVTAEDPDQWSTGNRAMPGGGDIRGITWWAAPPSQIGTVTTNGLIPILRLTCVIEDDLRMAITAKKRVSSPTQFARWRVADARDHFQYTSVDRSSANYSSMGGDGTDPVVVRDDTTAALSHARALRSAHEMPPLAGSITMQGTVPVYQIGDRISRIVGRNIVLYQNAGLGQGESPTYPTIVSRDLHFIPRAYTEIHLSDLRSKWATRNAY